MKDTQVDLCGQIDVTEDDVFPVRSKEERFSFACNGCGGCCRGRADIVLSGYDLFRIARRFALPIPVAVHAFCRQYIGKNSGMPVVRLQPRVVDDGGAGDGDCQFLHENHCAIHEVEPLVCALYPLGQEIGLDGTVRYFQQTVHCGGEIYEARVCDFLARYEIAAREEIDVAWAKACIALARGMKALHVAHTEKKISEKQLVRAQTLVYEALYLDYSFDTDYLLQFTANVAKIERYLARCAAICKFEK